jgi:uncharacterized protein (DUF305 family)
MPLPGCNFAPCNARVADMNHRAKLIAALSASAIAGFVLAALLLPVTAPAASPASADAVSKAGAAAICSIASEQAAPFYAEISAVNMQMHAGMDVVPSGDVDRDFMRMMIPHHQGAIDMALVLLKYGHDEKLKRLAQSIVIEQAQEIITLRSLLGAPAATPSAEHPAHQ